MRSLVAGTTVPVSTTSAGLAGNGKSLRASLDETGQFITFESDASDLVTNDLNVSTDTFVRRSSRNQERLACGSTRTASRRTVRA